MSGFDYISAASLEDALTILSREKEHACVIAGATNVINKINLGKIQDKLLLSIDGLDELRGIEEKDGYVVIGAMTCMHDVAISPLIQEKAPALYQAAQVFADPTTRNRATIGGNIADASPAADSAPALLVLKAEVIVRSLAGERIIPIDEFFLHVGKTAMTPDELVTAVRFRPNPSGAFTKIGLRNSLAISVISAAASIQMDAAGKVASCAIALGSVAPKPVRAYHAEQALLGHALTDETIAAMKEAVKSDICPIDDVRATAAYRLGVSGVIVERTVHNAL